MVVKVADSRTTDLTQDQETQITPSPFGEVRAPEGSADSSLAAGSDAMSALEATVQQSFELKAEKMLAIFQDPSSDNLARVFNSLTPEEILAIRQDDYYSKALTTEARVNRGNSIFSNDNLDIIEHTFSERLNAVGFADSLHANCNEVFGTNDESQIMHLLNALASRSAEEQTMANAAVTEKTGMDIETYLATQLKGNDLAQAQSIIETMEAYNPSVEHSIGVAVAQLDRIGAIPKQRDADLVTETAEQFRDNISGLAAAFTAATGMEFHDFVQRFGNMLPADLRTQLINETFNENIAADRAEEIHAAIETAAIKGDDKWANRALEAQLASLDQYSPENRALVEEAFQNLTGNRTHASINDYASIKLGDKSFEQTQDELARHAAALDEYKELMLARHTQERMQQREIEEAELNPQGAERTGGERFTVEEASFGVGPELGPDITPATHVTTEAIHTVTEGESLWNICKDTYGDPDLYSLLAMYNDIADANLIHPGQKIALPEKEELLKLKLQAA